MYRIAKNILMVVLAVGSFLANQVQARDASYGGADLERALRLQAERLRPTVDGGALVALERKLEAEQRRQQTDAIVVELDEARARWERTTAQLDAQLRRSIRNAQRDTMRRWVVLLNVVSLASRIGADLAALGGNGNAGAERPERGSAADAGSGPGCFRARTGCVDAPQIQTLGAKRETANPPPSTDRMDLAEAIGKLEPPEIELTQEDRDMLAYIAGATKNPREMKRLMILAGFVSPNPVNLAIGIGALKSKGKIFDKLTAFGIYRRLEMHIYLENCSQSSCPHFRKLSDLAYDQMNK